MSPDPKLLQRRAIFNKIDKLHRDGQLDRETFFAALDEVKALFPDDSSVLESFFLFALPEWGGWGAWQLPRDPESAS